MTKLDDNGKRELIQKLKLTQRRVDQLIDAGVIVAGGNDHYDLELNLRRYEAYREKDATYVTTELVIAAEKFEEGLRRLRQEPNIAKRRKMADRDKIGHNIGRLDNAFLLGIAMASEGQRPLLNIYTGRTIGDAMSEYFSLLGMMINDDVDAATPRRKKAG